jgi:hypothetical protein
MPVRSTGGLRWRKEEERGKQARGGGVRVDFIGQARLSDGREREGERGRSRAELKTAGGAGVLDGVAWQPLGVDCLTWNGKGGQRKRRGGGRKDRATRGTGSGWCRAAGAREGASGGGHARAEEHRRSGARGRRWRTRLQKADKIGTLL